MSSQTDPRKLLADHIEAEGLSFQAVADRLGVSRAYVSYLVNLKRPMTWGMARRIKAHWPDVFLAFMATQMADEPEKAAV